MRSGGLLIVSNPFAWLTGKGCHCVCVGREVLRCAVLLASGKLGEGVKADTCIACVPEDRTGTIRLSAWSSCSPTHIGQVVERRITSNCQRALREMPESTVDGGGNSM